MLSLLCRNILGAKHDLKDVQMNVKSLSYYTLKNKGASKGSSNDAI